MQKVEINNTPVDAQNIIHVQLKLDFPNPEVETKVFEFKERVLSKPETWIIERMFKGNTDRYHYDNSREYYHDKKIIVQQHKIENEMPECAGHNEINYEVERSIETIGNMIEATKNKKQREQLEGLMRNMYKIRGRNHDLYGHVKRIMGLWKSW